MKTREKLKTYFIGFGIALVLVGLMLYARGVFVQRQPQGQQQQPQQQQPTPQQPATSEGP